MTGTYWVAICDRCGYEEKTQDESALRLPTDWGIISIDMNHFDMCPQCRAKFLKTFEEYMKVRATDEHTDKGHRPTKRR